MAEVITFKAIPHDCSAEMALPEDRNNRDHVEAYCDTCETRHGFKRFD